jgi:hypothetical protein
VADRCADASDLRGGNRRPDAAAADEDPAIGLAVGDRSAEASAEVRVVVGRVRAVAAEILVVVLRIRSNSSLLRAAPPWSAAKATRIGRLPLAVLAVGTATGAGA